MHNPYSPEGDESWNRFLQWLHQDPDRSAIEFKSIRQSLIGYFKKRGGFDAESLADDTIDRVVHLLVKFGDELPDSPLRFCYGVARFISKEETRKRARRGEQESFETLEDPTPSTLTTLIQEQESTDRCLQNCLQKLDVKKREIFLRYYLVEPSLGVKVREILARELGITLQLLRLQMFRLKTDLRNCIQQCQQA